MFRPRLPRRGRGPPTARAMAWFESVLSCGDCLIRAPDGRVWKPGEDQRLLTARRSGPAITFCRRHFKECPPEATHQLVCRACGEPAILGEGHHK